ncbi:hypothetical protein Elgi_38720 [Paenibacillus elgii]|nr:hypothetical protein Elgi_38720 [Paenibacillus elgii]
MAAYPSSYTIVLFPLINFIVICFVFRNKIIEFDFNKYIKDRSFWTSTYQTLIIGAIGQAIANITMQMIGINSPDISFAYHMVAAPVMSVIFSSVNEEIVYRKVIFGYLDKKFGFWAGAVLSSLIFALSHYNYAGWIGFLTIGLVWCWAYKRTENIAINILSHMALNLIFFIKITFMGG